MTPRWGVSTVAALIFATSISADAATIEITMDNLVISPAEASAKVGDSIEWINKDVFAHTATARNGDWDIALPPNNRAIVVLKRSGTVEYFCRFHPNMKATLTVAP